VNLLTIPKEERLGLLKKYATINPALNSDVNEVNLNRFKTVVRDRDLSLKNDVLRMVTAGTLQRVGNRFLLAESGTVIGNSFQEALLWFKDAKNSAQVNILYVTMNEVGLKLPASLTATKKPIEAQASAMDDFTVTDEA
jgi:hypothetical protein